MRLVYRQATLSDIISLMKIDRESFDDSATYDDWAEEIRAGGVVVLECSDAQRKVDNILGYLAFQIVGNKVVIKRLAVARVMRRKHVGSALLTWVDRNILPRYKSVEAVVPLTNLGACNLFKKAGYLAPKKGGIIRNAFFEYGEYVEGVKFVKQSPSDGPRG